MAALTNLIGGLALLVFSLPFPTGPRPPLRRYVLLASLFTPCAICFALAVGLSSSRAQVIEVNLINYLWPVLTLFAMALIQRRTIRALALPATMVALVGILLVTTGGDLSWSAFTERIATHPAPYAAGFLSALCWAAYSAVSSITAERSTRVMAELITLTGIIALLFMWCLDPPRGQVPVLAMIGAAGCLAGGYALWDIGTRLGDENIVISFSYALPLFSVIVTSWILSVPIRFSILIGAIFLVLGAILSSQSTRPR